jgi:hypothetical protein
MTVTEDIAAYNRAQAPDRQAICDRLAAEIGAGLPEATSKLWHGGPVWFLSGNPIVGYWVRKASVQLLFWSGQSFDAPGLKPEGKFKAAEASFRSLAEIDSASLAGWLAKSRAIQWDYRNIVKRRGVLELLPPTGAV